MPPGRRLNAAAMLDRPDGVSEQVWRDFLQLRRSRKAPLTLTALQCIEREAKRADIDLNEALQVCCGAAWQSFRAEWYTNRMRAAHSQSTSVGGPLGTQLASQTSSYVPLRPRYLSAQERQDLRDEEMINRVLSGQPSYSSGIKTIDVQADEIPQKAHAPLFGSAR